MVEGDGNIQDLLLIQHSKITGQSQMESESTEEEVGCTVDSVVKERGCKIFSFLPMHVNKQLPFTTLRQISYS